MGPAANGARSSVRVVHDVGNGLPLHFHLTAGQAHEWSMLDALLMAADECLLDEDGERIAYTFQPTLAALSSRCSHLTGARRLAAGR